LEFSLSDFLCSILEKYYPAGIFFVWWGWAALAVWDV
jgi:hypothetical protein